MNGPVYDRETGEMLGDPQSVNWAGRTFGELTADEKHRAAKAAGDQLSRELAASADAISAVLSQPLYPDVTVHLSTGCDGNIGAVMATVRVALDRARPGDAAGIMASLQSEIFAAESYTESLAIVMRYVTVT